jgi:hypothetical protein
MKLKGQYFETVPGIQRESQAVLFHGAFAARKNDGITVYLPKETILKEMAAKIKLRQHFFFDLVWELSDSTLYTKQKIKLTKK